MPVAVDFESAKDGELIVKPPGAPKKIFKFDSVFGPEENQERVFEKTSPFATSVLDGYNVCIFAYGQTGTGKTFTMEGTEEALGVNYRTLEELFRLIKEREGHFQYEINVSALEVYNEQIHDLLSGSQPGVAAKRLEVRQVTDGVHHVLGLVEANVSNMKEVWEVLQIGITTRAVGSTNANEHSSQSHCIHCVMVKGENIVTKECTRSKLWLIDNMVTTKQLKGGKETKMDVLVMENLLFRRSVTRVYDLKGSARSRYNSDLNGNNKVLLDQNLIEMMPTSPIFVGNKAKRLLERAVWNDIAFLAHRQCCNCEEHLLEIEITEEHNLR